MILIVPKVLTVAQYGYWQLFLFYGSYVTLYTFGWSDGLYLRYGGADIHTLDKKTLTIQFKMIVLCQMIIAAGLLLYSLQMTSSEMKMLLSGLALSAMCININYFFTHLLQATGQFKQYAANTIFSKLAFGLGMLVLLFLNNMTYDSLVLASVIAAFLSLVYSFSQTKTYFFEKPYISRSFEFKEAKLTISSGYVLLLANTINMLIIGVVRQSVESRWGIETFAQVSLVLSFLSFTVSIINACSMVFYPILSRVAHEALPNVYRMLKKLIYPILICYLLTIFIAEPVIKLWLPKYVDSVYYLKLLFPIGMIEMKMSILNHTVLKVMRKEKAMLLINSIAVVLSLSMTVLLSIVEKNITMLLFSLVLVLFVRMILSDSYLMTHFKQFKIGAILYDLLLLVCYYVAVFIMPYGYLIIGSCLLIYLWFNRGYYLLVISKYDESRINIF